ncbi:LytTR family two component transcriptional regulator [Mobilisporobacter senegalensis]|uniref:Stage 0 sporulation protein A homolog n=1 Tax=Mobilisporobacter senegalensis TaxID=1329262 RepID=A0A3N1XR62_9FIRM|nr:LytTR family DNA-binding domain-containing protein [Mobilisporobacter senegalensis]ROR29126.1 LytTR family two component transcriptional regulator [Mobilisporobacter senegalensis]
MITVVICDDEQAFINRMKEYIKRFSEENKEEFSVREFTSGQTLLNSYNANFQIIFLDIKMPELDGIETAKRIRQMDSNVIIIFLTSLVKYVLAGYSVNAANYLIKPLEYKKFKIEMEKAVIKAVSIKNGYITVKNDKGFFKIYLSTLKYIETYQRNTMIHTTKEDIISYKKMQDHEKDLEGYPFVRCHTSYIVNMQYIESVVGNDLTLSSGEIIPISKQKKKDLMQNLAEYLGSEL